MKAMSERARAVRNLSPHKPAKAAMFIYGERYSRFGGGSMDFWDSLTKYEKNVCRRLVSEVAASDPEPTP